MERKPVRRKFVNEYLSKGFREGKTRAEIYSEIRPEFNDSNKLARLIAYTPHPDLKRKYGWMNYILIVAFGLMAVLHIINTIAMFTSTDVVIDGSVPVAAFMELIVLFWLIKFDYPGFNFAIAMCVIYCGVLLIAYNRLAHITALIGASAFIVLGVMGYLARKKMFSHLSYDGIKRDKNGNYLLGD